MNVNYVYNWESENSQQNLFEFMGNICCQTEVDKFVFDDQKAFNMDHYQPSTLPTDQELQQWLQAHIQSENPQLLSVMKHKLKDRYFYGQWRDGLPEGNGTIYEPNKLLFNGNFVNGLVEGKAYIKFIDQLCEFEGDLKDGKANGNGTLDNFKNKYKFSGEWKESRPQKGTLTFAADQNISNIEFEDLEHRKAVINFRDQRRYEGEISLVKLVPHGRGRVQFPFKSNKSFYDGEWSNGQMQGQGLFLWTDGSSYDGQFVKGKKDGKGKFTFVNGNYYDGYWLEGKQDGVGTLFNKEHEVLKKGSWRNGQFVSTLNEEDWIKEEKQSVAKHEKILSELKAQENLISKSKVEKVEKIEQPHSHEKKLEQQLSADNPVTQFEPKTEEKHDHALNALNGEHGDSRVFVSVSQMKADNLMGSEAKKYEQSVEHPETHPHPFP